jgi:hypothetical protein
MEGQMPRYYFDIQNGKTFPDNVGSEHDNLDGARFEVRRALAEIAAGVEKGKDAFQVRMDVRDDAGNRVITATLMMMLENAH